MRHFGDVDSIEDLIQQLEKWKREGARAEVDITTDLPMRGGLKANVPGDGRWGYTVEPTPRKFDVHVIVTGFDLSNGWEPPARKVG